MLELDNSGGKTWFQEINNFLIDVPGNDEFEKEIERSKCS